MLNLIKMGKKDTKLQVSRSKKEHNQKRIIKKRGEKKILAYTNLMSNRKIDEIINFDKKPKQVVLNTTKEHK
jgi:hypothetical protein